MRQAIARLESAGFLVAAELDGYTKMVKVFEDDGLRALTVLIPHPAMGEEHLAVGSLHSVLEQAGMQRSEFDGLAVAGRRDDKPWYDLRLVSLVDRD